MKKSELNKNIHLSEGNIKSKGTDDIMFLTWSLPCKICCPYATEMCKNRCFAKKNENFKNVINSRHRNLEETKKETFVSDMIEHLKYHLSRKKASNKKIIVRIHASGDFYNLEYLKKWIDISNYFKGNENILFQAYTKSMPILIEYIETNNCKLSPEQTIKNINIHLVWSIWNDTPKKYTDVAKSLNFQTFTALPKTEIEKKVKEGAFLCNGDCGNCKECYTGKSLEIVIPYH